MPPTRRGLVLQAGTVENKVIVMKDDKARVAEVERLVHATIPPLQWAAGIRALQQQRREWLADIDNQTDPTYDSRQERVAATDRMLDEVETLYRRNARAARVQAIRMSPGVRETLFDRFGLDYRETTGDADADLDRQWAKVVEIAGIEIPF